jgi:hypothetical protein
MENKTNGEIKVVELPDMVVASCFSTGRSPEAEVISYMESWAGRNRIDYKKMRKFGFDIPVSENQSRLGLRSFEYWITVPETTMGSGGVKIKNIKKSVYAVYRIHNPYKDPAAAIQAGWRMLHEWAEKYKELKTKEKIAAGIDDKTSEDEAEERENYMLEEIVETKDGVCLDLYFPLE